jgi:hypothetical protein
MAVKRIVPKFIISSRPSSGASPPAVAFVGSIGWCPAWTRLRGGAGAQLLAVGQQQQQIPSLALPILARAETHRDSLQAAAPTLPCLPPTLESYHQRNHSLFVVVLIQRPACYGRRAWPARRAGFGPPTRTPRPAATTASLDSRDASCCGNDNLQRGL